VTQKPAARPYTWNDCCRYGLPTFADPVVDRADAARLIRDVEPSFGEEFLDIAVVQGEAEIQPYCVLDDLGRKVMTAVAERSHAIMLSDTPRLPTRFP